MLFVLESVSVKCLGKLISGYAPSIDDDDDDDDDDDGDDDDDDDDDRFNSR